MKYEITLITAAGIVKEIYTDEPENENFETVKEFETRMKEKHGTFIMQSCKEI